MAAAALAVAAFFSASCQSGGQRFVSVYAGPYTDNSLPEEIALLQPLDFEDATLVAAAISQVIAEPSENYRWEIEGNFVQWFGDQDHQEIAGLATFRWLSLPWDHWIDSSIAFGNGLSWATEVPALEELFHPDTGGTQLLYHIAVEIAFELPSIPDWETFVRVHHRSGVFGVFDDVDGGSNVLALGLRYGL